MMRNLFLAAILMLCALLIACADPVRVARREVDRANRTLIKADTGLRRLAHAQLLQIATEEGTARGKAMLAAGCPSAALTPAPGAPADCARIVAESQKRYGERIASANAAVVKVDQAIAAAYNVLLVVLDVLEDIDIGFGPGAKTSQQKLAVLVGDVVRACTDAARVYEELKALWGAK